MWRAIAFVRAASPRARWYWRTIFHADSTASEPPLVKKAFPIPSGASPARRSASSMAGAWATPQLVVKGRRSSWAVAASAISAPYE